MNDTRAGAPAVDVDPFDPAQRANPYPAYHRLRERAPVYRHPRGMWLLSRHRDCVAVLRDSRFGHGTGDMLARNAFRRPIQDRSLPFILLDPPEHTRLRSLVAKAFTPRMVDRLGPLVGEIVDALLDAAIERGEVDLMGSFAYDLPVTVISELLGVPEADREAVKELSHQVARAVDPDFTRSPEERRRRDEAFAAFDDYFRTLLEERRRAPTDDLLSELAAVQDEGERLAEGELLTTCILLYVAGHETTMDLVGNGMLALLRNPDQMRRLREDPGLADKAVEELLRYDPPTQVSRRTALDDVEIDGHLVERGEVVVVIRGAANRDPEVFADPDRLDLGRSPHRHLAFDGGIHYCLGAGLARLEGRTAFAAVVRKTREVELLDDDPPYRENLVIRGLARLPVRFRAA